MNMTREEALQPEAGLSGLSDSDGTWLEITLFNWLSARELDYNNVKNDNDDKDYSPNNPYVHSISNHFCGRRSREQLSDEEDKDEEAPTRKIQCLEHDGIEVLELTNQESSSYASQTLSSTEENVFIIDDSSSSDDFWWSWNTRRRVQMRKEEEGDEEEGDEEAPTRKIQCLEKEHDGIEVFELTDQETCSSSSQTSSFNLVVAPIENDSSSSDHFWWRWKTRRRKQMSGEEKDDEGAPCRKRQHMEQQDEDNEVFDLTDQEISSSSSQTSSLTLEVASIKNDSSSSDHFWWRWKTRRRKQMSGEEKDDEGAPCRKRQHMEQQDEDNEVSDLTDQEISSSSSQTSSLTLEVASIKNDSSSSDHFWWRCKTWRKRMCGEENDYVEALPSRRQHMEPEEDEYKLFEPINQESNLSSSKSLEYMPIVYNSLSRDQDDDEEATLRGRQQIEQEEDKFKLPTLVFFLSALNAASSSEDVWCLEQHNEAL